MKRRFLVMPVFVSLVAGGLLLDLAHGSSPLAPGEALARSHLSHHAGAETSQTEVPKQAPSPAEQAQNQTSGPPPKVLYDLNSLPKPVQDMLRSIIAAAESGDVENMRPVLESNELKPLVSTNAADDPIEVWKKASADGDGREVLAAILNVLASGFVLSGQGKDAMYIWPYFAAIDMTKLSPSEQVDLYRIVPASEALAMQKAGKYSYYRLAISPTGIWHYFLR